MSQNSIVSRSARSSKTRTMEKELDVIRKSVDDTVNYDYKNAWNWITSFFREKKELPNMFLIGVPSVNDFLSYRQVLTRSTMSPYTFKHKLRYEDQVITAISVLPLNNDLRCPEVDILDGGVNYNYIEVRLRPMKGGEWGCDIKICACQRQESAWQALIDWLSSFSVSGKSEVAIRNID